jgi:clan AA aspartic protease
VVEDRGVAATHIVGRVTGPTGQQVEVRFLVDSGATYSLLPYDVWRQLGIVSRRTQAFTIADGTRIVRAVAGCRIALPQGEAGDTPVILGEPGDVALLGLVTLEELGLVLNPFDRTLHPMEHLLLRAG